MYIDISKVRRRIEARRRDMDRAPFEEVQFADLLAIFADEPSTEPVVQKVKHWLKPDSFETLCGATAATSSGYSVDRDEVTCTACRAAMEPKRTRLEPQGCPTPGACSCHGAITAEIAAAPTTGPDSRLNVPTRPSGAVEAASDNPVVGGEGDVPPVGIWIAKEAHDAKH